MDGEMAVMTAMFLEYTECVRTSACCMTETKSGD